MSDENKTEENTVEKTTVWEGATVDAATGDVSFAGGQQTPRGGGSEEGGVPAIPGESWIGHASGVHASGGVGRVNDGYAENYGNLGQAADIFTGSDDPKLAIDPSGQLGGGILNPEQSKSFIDYVWDATVLAKDGRRITMRANTMELEKVNVGERVVRAAAQADGTYKNAGATFTKVDLSTKKLRLDWEVSTEALEDNIEGAALEDHLVRLMTQAFANDIEDLAINGNMEVSTGSVDDNFLQIMDGFCIQVEKGAHAAVPPVFGTPNAAGELRQYAWGTDTWAPTPGANLPDDPTGTMNYYTKQTGTGQDNAGNAQATFDRFINEGGSPVLAAESVCPGGNCTGWTTQQMQEIILAMPRKYRAIKNGLRFYAGSDTFAQIVAANGTGTNTGTWPASYEYANAYLGGAAQELGGPQATRVLGIPVLEVPYFPDDYVELTYPQNRIWGIQRDITVNREYVAKKDTIEYTVFMRFGIAWEELNAVSYMKAPTVVPAP